jgi:hypothetical protein
MNTIQGTITRNSIIAHQRKRRFTHACRIIQKAFANESKWQKSSTDSEKKIKMI